MNYDCKKQRERGILVADALMKKYGEVIKSKKPSSCCDERFAFIVGMSKYQPLSDKEMLDYIFAEQKDYVKTKKELPFCTFSPFRCMVLLLQYKDVCSKWVKKLLEYRVLTRMEKNMLKQWDFVGVNDNTPAMIAVLCVLAGEYFNKKEWLETGLRRISQFEQMLEDRVFISEFTSCTYSPITLNAFARLQQFTTSDEIRKRALKIEQALWKQLLSVWHRDTSKCAGPYSRAYMVDSVAQTSQIRMLMYQVMGDKLLVNALNTLFRTKDGFNGIQLHGYGLPIWFLEHENCNFANTVYHCPKKYIKEAMKRKYPVFITGDAQLSPSYDNYLVPNYDSGLEGQGRVRGINDLLKDENVYEYSAGTTEIFSYIDNYYTLGTCTKEFHNGVQTDSLYSLISSKSPATKQEEITSLFTRYEINNEPSGETLKKDMGRKMAYSYLNDGMILYSPKIEQQEISCLKCKALIDNRFNAVKKILTSDGKELKIGDKITSDKAIFVEFDKVYIALYPMTIGETRTVEIEKENTFISISIIDYKGRKKHFSKKQLKLTVSGFTVRIRNQKQAISFDNFVKQMSEFTITDCLEANLHTRFAVERQTKFVGKGITLESKYSPISEGIRFIRANGKLLRAKIKQ